MQEPDTKVEVAKKLLKLMESDATAPPASFKQEVHWMYERLYESLDASDFGDFAYFMNYGYHPGPEPGYAQVVLPPNYYDGLSHRLVLEVIGDCPMNGRDVLDVGCGRGGVAHVLATHFKPSSYTGIDLSERAIRFCREAHPQAYAAFHVGDAEDLPCADASMDVVINLESAHYYPNIARFFAEVYRVLRPGGTFLFSDMIPAEQTARIDACLLEVGFSLLRSVDVTPNVCRACEEVGRRRLRAYPDPAERAYMAEFLSAPGSTTYRKFEQGALGYWIYKLQRPF